MDKTKHPCPALRLVVDNSGRLGPVVSEVPFKFLKGGSRKPAATFNAVEKLAIVHHKRGKPSLRNALPRTEALRVLKEPLLQRQFSRFSLHADQYAGFPPHASTGFFPRSQGRPMRGESGMASMGITDRVKERLADLGKTANAVSREAGLDRDYVGDMIKKFNETGIDQHPGTNTLEKLAIALKCRYQWLGFNDGPKVDPEHNGDFDTYAKALLECLPEDQRASAKELLDLLKLKAETTPPRELSETG